MRKKINEFKSELSEGNGKIGKELFLIDIAAVEEAGIIPKNQEDVENIKKKLNE